MWEFDYKESWALKNWCFWTVVLEKTLESPLYCKIKPVHPKGNQSWLFIGRNDAETETPILQPLDEKSWLIGEDTYTGKDWRQEEKGTTEDEMVGWHHRLDGHEFEQAPGVGDGQRGLVCCSPWNSLSQNTGMGSVQFSHSVVSDALRPHGLQHARLPVHHQLLELTQTHVHWVGDAIQPSHPLSSPFLSAFNLSQHQGLFQWVSSLHQVAKALEFQLQHQSLQWIFRTDFL